MHVPAISEKLLRLLSWRQSADRESALKPADEPSLRAELFSIDQLERHAKVIAASHQLAAGRARDKLLPRLDENQRVLIETYDLVTEAAASSRPPNGYLIISTWSKSKSAKSGACCPPPIAASCRDWRVDQPPAFRALMASPWN